MATGDDDVVRLRELLHVTEQVLGNEREAKLLAQGELSRLRAENARLRATATEARRAIAQVLIMVRARTHTACLGCGRKDEEPCEPGCWSLGLEEACSDLDSALSAAPPSEPEVVWWCPMCGQRNRIDEDGCCGTCGRDAYELPAWIDTAKIVDAADEAMAQDTSARRAITMAYAVAREVERQRAVRHIARDAGKDGT